MDLGKRKIDTAKHLTDDADRIYESRKEGLTTIEDIIDVSIRWLRDIK